MPAVDRLHGQTRQALPSPNISAIIRIRTKNPICKASLFLQIFTRKALVSSSVSYFSYRRSFQHPYARSFCDILFFYLTNNKLHTLSTPSSGDSDDVKTTVSGGHGERVAQNPSLYRLLRFWWGWSIFVCRERLRKSAFGVLGLRP